jgi:integrase/recombinase XerD
VVRRLDGKGIEGPLAPYGAGFAEWLIGQGYAMSSVSHHLGLMGWLSRWLAKEDLGPDALSEAVVHRFRAARSRGGLGRPSAGLKPLLAYLRSLGVAPSPQPERDESPQRCLLLAYERYLIAERCLRPTTVIKYLRIARVFLAAVPDPLTEALSGLSADQVTGFICEKRAGAKSIAGGLRAFLRYLYLSGTVKRQLAEAVSPAAGWKLSGLPARLDAAVVAAIMATCNRTSEAGCRDYAILLLLARLGLRAHEVAGLELEDIRWRSGTLVLRRKGGRSEELPLPVDVGQAVADYLQIRPVGGAFRAVFMSVVAPCRPITSSSVTLVARRHYAAAGVASGGAHRLRHTLASNLLAAGASLAEIGLVLGHRSPFVTSIYAKVDRVALSQLVRLWPLTQTQES